MKNSNDTIGTRTRDLPACSAVPRPTAPPRAPRVDGGEWLTACPGRITRGKENRYQLYRRQGGPQTQSGRVRNISPSTGYDPLIVHPVASRYTDHAVPANN